MNYIFARSTLLATVLCLAALGSWPRGRRWWAVAWFAAALLAKEECVAFPAFLLLLHFSRSSDAERTEADRRDVCFVGSRGPASVASSPKHAWVGRRRSSGGHVAIVSAGTQGAVILRYLRMLLLPWGFTVDADIHRPAVWIGGARVAGGDRFWPASRRFSSGALAPDSGFWPAWCCCCRARRYFPPTDLAADRRMYLPMIGFAACVGSAAGARAADFPGRLSWFCSWASASRAQPPGGPKSLCGPTQSPKRPRRYGRESSWREPSQPAALCRFWNRPSESAPDDPRDSIRRRQDLSEPRKTGPGAGGVRPGAGPFAA